MMNRRFISAFLISGTLVLSTSLSALSETPDQCKDILRKEVFKTIDYKSSSAKLLSYKNYKNEGNDIGVQGEYNGIPYVFNYNDSIITDEERVEFEKNDNSLLVREADENIVKSWLSCMQITANPKYIAFKVSNVPPDKIDVKIIYNSMTVKPEKITYRVATVNSDASEIEGEINSVTDDMTFTLSGFSADNTHRIILNTAYKTVSGDFVHNDAVVVPRQLPPMPSTIRIRGYEPFDTGAWRYHDCRMEDLAKNNPCILRTKWSYCGGDTSLNCRSSCSVEPEGYIRAYLQDGYSNNRSGSGGNMDYNPTRYQKYKAEGRGDELRSTIQHDANQARMICEFIYE